MASAENRSRNGAYRHMSHHTSTNEPLHERESRTVEYPDEISEDIVFKKPGQIPHSRRDNELIPKGDGASIQAFLQNPELLHKGISALSSDEKAQFAGLLGDLITTPESLLSLDSKHLTNGNSNRVYQYPPDEKQNSERRYVLPNRESVWGEDMREAPSSRSPWTIVDERAQGRRVRSSVRELNSIRDSLYQKEDYDDDSIAPSRSASHPRNSREQPLLLRRREHTARDEISESEEIPPKRSDYKEDIYLNGKDSEKSRRVPRRTSYIRDDTRDYIPEVRPVRPPFLDIRRNYPDTEKNTKYNEYETRRPSNARRVAPHYSPCASDADTEISDGGIKRNSTRRREWLPRFSARRSPNPFNSHSNVIADPDGWILGIKYQKRTHEPSGRSSYDSHPEEDIENLPENTETVHFTARTGPFAEFVVHVIREYQSRGDRFENQSKVAPNNYLGTTVGIRSNLLITLLKTMAPYYPEISKEDDFLDFPEPQRFLYHHFVQLRQYVTSKEGDKKTVEHAKVLIKCLESVDSGELNIIKTIDGLNNNPTGRRFISFPVIWTVYKPGTVVIKRVSGDPGVMAYIVHSLAGHEKTLRKGRSPAFSALWITCWSVMYNEAGFFTRRMEKFPIEPYDGAIDIENLEVIPLQFLPDRDKISKALVERGRRYWALKGRNFMEHSSGPKNSFGDNTAVRVMVDQAAFQAHVNRTEKESNKLANKQTTFGSLFGDVSDRNYGGPHTNDDSMGNSDNEDSPQIRHRTRKLKSSVGAGNAGNKPQTLYSQCGYMHEDDIPTDGQLMLCSSHVWGYSLREKDWGRYAVDNLYKVEFKKKSFDKLVMNSYYKDIVRAMVANHVEEDANQFRDLVDGKGQGVIILLHGPPGVGKTLTAECIADLYERPLIAVTCGDIGTDPNMLEAKLEDVFRRAEEWGAVLLLDEADVFLAERDLESLQRNALVSIFLRTLEYFNGILFLTTNRIGTIDEAFQSRLHITIGLSALSVEDRKQIWHNFLGELKHLTKDARRVLIKKSRSDWALQPLNGRQIRNCVRTALVLARQAAVPVNQTHFERVIQLGNEYTKYLTTLKKMDMDHLAEAMGTRLNAFSRDEKGKARQARTAADEQPVEVPSLVRRNEHVDVEDEPLLESERDFHM